ncbi:hypothetical protein CEXT_701491 [Caerostris extrusa]|uniref:Uncharacterized protein n=1 Tax=Caerostris extrusa TaxID=172846 RepID=A0AAV4UQ96_CAEEX|nr:hypothetical protein CEXT_701491 [Caerostris extrusa]
MYSSTSQENNNLYPDPTAWSGEASESPSSSSPTYDQPTLSPSTSPTSINIPGQAYRLVSKRKDGSGPSFISYADVHCCSSVVTVSGGTIEGKLCSLLQCIQQRYFRSGSICSETGERRHHRSAGSSPTTARSNHALENTRYMDSRYASSSHIMVNDRTINARNTSQGQDDGNVRHFPVWVVNSMAVSSRPEYDVHSSSVKGDQLVEI